MKRFFLFTLSLLTMVLGAQAQESPHWTYTGGQYQHETYVYSDLILSTQDGNQTINAFSDLNAYEFAAFNC